MKHEPIRIREFSQALGHLYEWMPENGYVLISTPAQYLAGYYEDKKFKFFEDTVWNDIQEIWVFNAAMAVKITYSQEYGEYLCSLQDDHCLTDCQEIIEEMNSIDSQKAPYKDEVYYIGGHFEDCGLFTRINWQGNTVLLPVKYSDISENYIYLQVRRYFEFDEMGLLHTINWRPVDFLTTKSVERSPVNGLERDK